VHREDFQIVLVDTPGLHRPRTLLGKRLNDLVRDTYSEVDVIGLCIPADEAIGPGDRWIYEQIRTMAPRTTLVVIVTKIDKVSRDKVAAQLMAVNELAGEHAAEIVPVSAATGEQVDVLIDVLAGQLPPGPAFYPDGELTDEPEEVLMAELIREAGYAAEPRAMGVDEFPRHLRANRMLIASVSYEVGDDLPVTKKGGHLVVVLGADVIDGKPVNLYINNPSGRSLELQSGACIPVGRFLQGYTGRVILAYAG